MVRNLIELFRQIDVNNDGTLEWDEFTKHLIELGKYYLIVDKAGLASTESHNVDTEKKYNPSPKNASVEKEKHDTEI